MYSLRADSKRKTARGAPAATAATARGEAPFSIDKLLERCANDAPTVRIILDEFEKQAVGDLGRIERSLQSGDGGEAARVAHTLKGAAGILSAGQLWQAALQLEQAGRSASLDGAEVILGHLRDQVRRCLDHLPAARAEMAGGPSQSGKPGTTQGTLPGRTQSERGA